MAELDRLIRFSVIAEELSFSQAARRLRVDQPWLSRQIQQLELQLGFTLFVRSTRKVALTREGEELFEHTRELAKIAENCQHFSREMSRSHSFEISIGVNPYTFWIPERKQLFEKFRSRYNRASLEVVSNYTPRLISKLRKRLIDVALVGPPFDFRDLETLILHSSPVSLLVPPEDPLADTSCVPMSALAGRTIPTVKPQLNTAIHERIYAPLIEAGAIPLVVPEGDAAIPFYAADERLPMVCIGERHNHQGAVADFVHVTLEGSPPLVQYALVRRREPPRSLLNHFWNVAKRLVKENSNSNVAELVSNFEYAVAEEPRRIAVNA